MLLMLIIICCVIGLIGGYTFGVWHGFVRLGTVERRSRLASIGRPRNRRRP